MKIGELAEQTGLAPSKIRFYEARGLLGKITRLPNGYREYAPEAPLLLRLITSAQQAGFSLDEVQQVLPTDLSDWNHDALIAALEAKIAHIEVVEQRLARSKKDLRLLIRQIQTKPEDMDCAENARRLIVKMDKVTARRKAS